MKVTVRDVNQPSGVLKSPLGGKGGQPIQKNVLLPKIGKAMADQSVQKQVQQKPQLAVVAADTNDMDKAKLLLKDSMRSGTKCPCCGQHVKMYRRSINSTMAKALLIFYKRTCGSNRFFHLYDIFKDEKDPTVYRGDFAKLRFWGLIEELLSEKDPSKKSMGNWKITPAGIEFVLGKRKVAKYAFVYNNTVEGFGTDMISVSDALKTPFDYRSVMGHDITDIRGNLFDYSTQGRGRRDGTCVG